MPLASLPQFGRMVGASISVDSVAFDGVSHRGPATVDYQGPQQFRAISGRPFLQGPAIWTCTWALAVLDDAQALYTIFNLKLNTADGPRVTFSVNDPRNAGAAESYDCWMDEPQFHMSGLYVRDLKAVFTTVIQS